jgi:hypothetical protein
MEDDHADHYGTGLLLSSRQYSLLSLAAAGAGIASAAAAPSNACTTAAWYRMVSRRPALWMQFDG